MFGGSTNIDKGTRTQAESVIGLSAPLDFALSRLSRIKQQLVAEGCDPETLKVDYSEGKLVLLGERLATEEELRVARNHREIRRISSNVLGRIQKIAMEHGKSFVDQMTTILDEWDGMRTVEVNPSDVENIPWQSGCETCLNFREFREEGEGTTSYHFALARHMENEHKIVLVGAGHGG